MKLVNAIIRTTSLDRVVTSLEAAGIRHLTIFEVKVAGDQVGLFAAHTVYKIIQIIIPDEKVEEATRIILDNAHTGLAGDGLIAVLPVEHLINIQTMERIR
jgi:nitrogen regulatory protein P-II 1